MKEVLGNIRIGRVQCNTQDDYMSIEITDEKSGIEFVQVKLSMAEYGKLIAGLSTVDTKITVRGQNHIGKRLERKRGRVVIDKETYNRLLGGSQSHGLRDEVLGQWLRENAAEEGWNINSYLGSRGSIESADGTYDGAKALNFSYYRYVDDEA